MDLLSYHILSKEMGLLFGGFTILSYFILNFLHLTYVSNVVLQ